MRVELTPEASRMLQAYMIAEGHGWPTSDSQLLGKVSAIIEGHIIGRVCEARLRISTGGVTDVETRALAAINLPGDVS